jgi:Ni/Fe-hydrogenase subunit HybB-like protein
VRLGYYVAFIGAVISGLLLIIDLGRPLRFWHMLFESETGRPMFKYYSPISVGAWGLLLFGLFAFLAAVGSAADEGRIGWGRPLARGPVMTVIAIVGGILGFFLAGYTGVLLSVTNRPVWADSNWLGILFLISGASTAAALLALLGLLLLLLYACEPSDPAPRPTDIPTTAPVLPPPPSEPTPSEPSPSATPKHSKTPHPTPTNGDGGTMNPAARPVG